MVDAHTHLLSDQHITIYQLDIHAAVPENSFFSVGTHPHYPTQQSLEQEKKVRELIQHKNCLAIGETGLDSRYANGSEIQEYNYISQLKLAAEFELPVILHCVNSWDRCRFLHEKYAPNTLLIYHGFNKSAILQSVLEYPNSIISVGQSALSNTSLQTAIEQIPIHRLLLESDDKIVDFPLLYKTVAEIKSVLLSDFYTQIYSNAQRIFNYDELARTH